jgi:hypothetical protein
MSAHGTSRVSVRIGHLRLALGDGAGHEHRVRPIVTRAMHLLHQRLCAEAATGVSWPSMRVHTLRVPAVRLAMAAMSDDGVAERMAEALHGALRAHPRSTGKV